MRVFMLGWEFPPFISGGLGTACYGLTKALSRQHTDITFVLPKAVGTDYSLHVRLLSPQSPAAAAGDKRPEAVASTYRLDDAPGLPTPAPGQPREFEHVTFKAVPSRVLSPYGGGAPADAGGPPAPPQHADQPRGISFLRSMGAAETGGPGSGDAAGVDYGGDLLTETRRYAGLCVHLAADADFDVIHAHDWLTFPAGMAVAAATGKPLVVQVHSTEFDRAGENIHQQIYDIERAGLHAADRVVAVSHLTASILQNRYAVAPEKIDVVYNGIENGQPAAPAPGSARIRKNDKIVLFLGRITMQKGPEYFVAAAKRVLEKVDKVKFVMAGAGDKVAEVIDLAARQGLGHKILFTGFLRGPEVSQIFRMADVYVMPSVSEPFGIATLEAISHDVPVIISKQSGVAEVLEHALKVDFWDTDEMANKIIAVLRHPPLASTLRQHADIEVRKLTWDGAATKLRQVYAAAVAGTPAPAPIA